MFFCVGFPPVAANKAQTRLPREPKTITDIADQQAVTKTHGQTNKQTHSLTRHTNNQPNTQESKQESRQANKEGKQSSKQASELINKIPNKQAINHTIAQN